MRFLSKLILLPLWQAVISQPRDNMDVWGEMLKFNTADTAAAWTYQMEKKTLYFFSLSPEMETIVFVVDSSLPSNP